MREVAAELKDLRLYGMSCAWEDLVAQGNTDGLQNAQWLVEHLLDMEHADRALRSIRYQLHSAKFPVHRDLAGFEFEHSKVEHGLIKDLATMAFTQEAHNVVFIGGTGTGKTHLATALGVAGIMTLPLFRGVLNPRFTQPFYAVPRTSVSRTAWG